MDNSLVRIRAIHRKNINRLAVTDKRRNFADDIK